MMRFSGKKKWCNLLLSLALALGTASFASAAPVPDNYSTPPVSGISTNDLLINRHAPATQDLITMVEHDPKLKAMLEKAIARAKEINPDRLTNPAQTLEEYYDYLDWAATAMPWSILPTVEETKFGSSLFDSIDQSLDYFYFISDIPLEELKGKGLYNNSLQYAEPYRSWMIKFTAQYGMFLNTTDSWNQEYYERALEDPSFHLQDGTYEAPENWHSFNDFFARHLSSPAVRPVSAPKDASVVVSPADSQPQGVWSIAEDGRLVQKKGVVIKSRRFTDVNELLADSAYKGAFNGGTLTHTFLDVNDYHRFHFPVSGTIKEVRLIHEDDAIGGKVVWSGEAGRYLLEADTPGWQMIETRGLVVIETEQYGLVAVLPIAMSQVSSVNFEDTVKVGAQVKKGDMMGCFLFGGSDEVMLFQKGVKVNMTVEPDKNGKYPHVNMGMEYARLSR